MSAENLHGTFFLNRFGIVSKMTMIIKVFSLKKNTVTERKMGTNMTKRAKCAVIKISLAS